MSEPPAVAGGLTNPIQGFGFKIVVAQRPGRFSPDQPPATAGGSDVHFAPREVKLASDT
jgi:hypothetical protein